MQKLSSIISLYLIILCLGVNAKVDIIALNQNIIEDGLIHHRFTFNSDKGPVAINILEIDLNSGYQVKPALAQSGSIWGKSTLTSIMNRENAIAGINANYFLANGIPIGALAIDHEWITGPVLNRGAISIDNKGHAHFARTSVTGTIKVLEGKYLNKHTRLPQIKNINQPPVFYPDDISFFNHWWENKIQCGNGKACLLIDSQGLIRDKINATDTIKPCYPTRSDYVLLSNYDNSFYGLAKGDRIKVRWEAKPDWSKMKHVIGGGPYLIHQGKNILNETLEHFTQSSGIRGNAPRTILGITNSNRLILLTADGRQDNSVGLRLEEMIDFLLDLGLTEAINLDGGGSTTMVIRDEVVNRPSDKSGQRKVSTALLVFKEQNKPQTKIIPGGP